MSPRLLALSVFTLVLSFFSLITSPAQAAVNFNNGTYLNLCGTGLEATAHTCNRGCNTSTGSCSSNQPAVVKFTCDGRQADCRQNETSFSTSQSIGNPGCGKTVQIDVFNHNCRDKGGWSCGNADLQDYFVWYSGDCPATPPTPASSDKPTPIPPTKPVQTSTPAAKPVEHKSACEDLDVAGGNDSLVPATVTLRARASDNRGAIQNYKFYFGDGKTEETTNPEISHKYEVSGTFTARVDVKDSQGNWKSSTACETQVRVRQSRVESHKSDCSDVTWTADNSSNAPSTVKFKVNGYDNKGSIQQYKLDFGNGVVKENAGSSFEQRYETAGTFAIKAYIKDSHGNWQGGDDNCSRTLYINTKPLTEQPKTGTPTLMTFAALVSGVGGVGTYLAAKRQARG